MSNQDESWKYKVSVKPCRDCVLYVKWDKATSENLQFTDSSGQVRTGSNKPLAVHVNKFHEHNNMEEATSHEQQVAQQNKTIAGYFNLINGTSPTGQNQLSVPQEKTPQVNNQSTNTNVDSQLTIEMYKEIKELRSDIALLNMKVSGVLDFKDIFVNYSLKLVEMLNDQRIDAESNLASFQEMMQKSNFKTAAEMVQE